MHITVMAVHNLKSNQTAIGFHSGWSKVGSYPYPAAADHRITQTFL